MREVATGKKLVICPMREVATGKKVVICPMREVATGKKVVICPMQEVATGKKVVICPMREVATGKFLLQYPFLDLSESNYFVKTGLPFREGNTKFTRIKLHEKTGRLITRKCFLKERNKKVFYENYSLLKREKRKIN